MTEAVAVYDEKLYNIINTKTLERRVKNHIRKAIKEIIEKRSELQKRYPSQYGIKIYEEELGNGIVTFAQAMARKLEKILTAHLNTLRYRMLEHETGVISLRTFIRIEDHNSLGYEKYTLFGSFFRFDIIMIITTTHETTESWDRIYETMYMVQVTIKGKGYRTRDENNKLYAVLEDYHVENIKITPYTV